MHFVVAVGCSCHYNFRLKLVIHPETEDKFN